MNQPPPARPDHAEPAGVDPIPYDAMRQYWDTHWTDVEFDKEYATNFYPRRQEEFAAIQRWLPRDGAVLEAGCSYGHVVKYFLEQGYQVWGLDYALSGLEIGHGVQADLPLVQGDIHALPLAENSLAGYLSFGVLEHFEFGPLPALREAYRVLRPGGIVAITMPLPTPLVRDWLPKLRRWDPVAPLKRHPRLRQAFGKAPLPPPSPAPPTYFYEKPYAPAQMRAFLEEAGFQVVHHRPIYHSFWLYLLGGVFRAPAQYMRENALAEWLSQAAKKILPWHTAFFSLAIGQKK